MKKKILYLMHVPWGWIKQRPHFIAQYLTAFFDVQVYHTEFFFKRLLVDTPLPPGLQISVLPMLRIAPHIEPVSTLNCWRLSYLLEHIFKRESFDLVWIPHPEFYAFVKNWLPAGVTMVCDCMDDYLEFSSVKKNKRRLHRIYDLEREMLNRADVIFVSSENLRKTIFRRHGLQKQVTVINNGIHVESGQSILPMQHELSALKRRGLFLVTYIGTVSKWLDIDLLLMALRRFPSMAFVVFGPLESKLPKHERIISFGPIEHKWIFQVMNSSDALVMPFRMIPLIESVNPVKLYEYIYSGKPTLSVAYGETEKFGDYVYLYRDHEEFLSLLQMIVDGRLTGKLPLDSCRLFASANTWKCRVQEIVRAIAAVDMNSDSRFAGKDAPEVL